MVRGQRVLCRSGEIRAVRFGLQGSKNRAKTDFDAQIAKLQKDKALLEEGVAKTVAQIEELKTDIKSMRESLKPQRAEIKQVEKEIAKLEAKKSKAE